MTSRQPLWDHQKKAIEFAAARAKLGQSLALFFEQGTGKTRTALEIIQQRYADSAFKSDCGAMLPTLVICPPVVISNWKNEILKYTDIPKDRILMLTGPASKRAFELKTAVAEKGRGLIVITNYEALLMATLFTALQHWEPSIIIWDESHRIKNFKAKRTKAAWKLSEWARFNYLLSGTPVLNSPQDLFAQYKAMDKGETFGSNFYAFQSRYFYDANAGMPSHVKFPAWTIRPGAIEQMNQLVQRSSMRVTKEECLDLPDLVHQTIEVEMAPEQARVYKEMHRDFVAFINGEACVAQLALTKALRLMQIVSGFVKLENANEVRFVTNPRQSALYDLLEELTPFHKVIVWAVFKQNYAQIREVCEELGVKYVEVHGETSPADRECGIKSFTEDQETRVFIGNPGAAGIGINLTVSDYAIYFSRNFSLEADLQSESRNHRGGSEIHAKITRIDLVTPKTIDELVLKKLADKEAMGENLISEIRRLANV